ncbi:hypothetical protein DL766_009736 [Monosporascus sp. MC13-8B]|uniref:EKC/KEOPS complex subunit BUD32 n=1 Tax=Monosporascus cannonballus TaxID=155416 RepID=A0ABY0HHQ2_9PEZI|nr:hypothetical protein DL763_010533 [Monosporascus cannonballus]RYO92090.1 hypothetical protein DL762_001825 [Monosporascus cannonballus]RYP14245.1 hypothetical protein DL766_009736 [Monosporascus sp. MC13-8B]
MSDSDAAAAPVPFGAGRAKSNAGLSESRWATGDTTETQILEDGNGNDLPSDPETEDWKEEEKEEDDDGDAVAVEEEDEFGEGEEGEGYDQPAYIQPDLVDIENIEHYRRGGFHPVTYGDMLAERFEVVKWRAVKIIRADQSYEERAELRLKQYLESQGVGRQEWEENHVSLPLEHFWLEGPNGRHLCESSAVLGPSVAERWEVRMPADRPPLLKQLFYQVARALRFLHAQGVCHGDFTPGNMLLRLGDEVPRLSHGEMLALLEERGSAPLELAEGVGGDDVGPPHAPSYVYEPVDLSNMPLRDDAAVIDFGESFLTASPPEWSGIPPEFASPEAIFNHAPGPGSDVWAFACAVVACLTREVLFSAERDGAAAWFEALLGPLPAIYRNARTDQLRRLASLEETTEDEKVWVESELERLESGEDSKGAQEHVAILMEHTGIKDPIGATLAKERIYKDYARDEKGNALPDERMVNIIHKMPEEEARQLSDLLKKIFKYEPKERIDMDEVLAHPWFANKAKPENRRSTPYDLMSLPPADEPPQEFPSRHSTPFMDEPSDEEGPSPTGHTPPGPSPLTANATPPSSPPPPETREPNTGPQPQPQQTNRCLGPTEKATEFAGKVRKGAAKKWKPPQSALRSEQQLAALLTGLLAGLVFLTFVMFKLAPKLRPAPGQCPQDTLLVPMTIKSSTSTYYRGLVAFSAPRQQGLNDTCICIVARGME